MRVVNQALGRVIRHRADFGAILLADERFARTDMRNNISYWARSLLTVRDSCATLGGDLQRFFRENEARAPPRRAAPHAAQHGPAKFHTMGQARTLCGGTAGFPCHYSPHDTEAFLTFWGCVGSVAQEWWQTGTARARAPQCWSGPTL